MTEAEQDLVAAETIRQALPCMGSEFTGEMLRIFAEDIGPRYLHPSPAWARAVAQATRNKHIKFTGRFGDDGKPLFTQGTVK